MSVWVRFGRLAAGLFRLTVLAGLVAGVPYGLVTQIGWPLPRTFPRTVDEVLPQVQEWLTTPFTGKVALNLFAVAMWILWGSFIASVIVEAPSRVRGVVPHRVPVLAPTQSLAGWLLSGITVAALAGGTMAAPATPPASSGAAPAVTLVVPEAGTPGGSAAPGAVTGSGAAGTGGLATASYSTADQPDRPTEALVHEVAREDWMWHIAGRYLGDEQRYREIAQLNPDLAARYEDYPDHIEPGDQLVLPDDARDRGERPHATGDLLPPAEPDRHQAGPDPPELPVEPAAPEPTGSTAAPPTTGAPSPTPTTPAAEPSTGPPAADQPPADDGEQPPDPLGVTLPSGAWISIGLAALIATAATVLRLHQRRRARVATRPIPLDVGPAPSELPESLAAADAAGGPTLEFTRDGTLPPGVLPAPPPPAPAGITATGQPVGLLDWPEPVLAVHGEGAVGAVRALLASAISTGVSEHPGAQPRMLIPADLLARLLPATAAPEGLDPEGTSYDGERLVVAADAATAVTTREEEMVYRRRILDAAGTGSLRELVEAGEHPEHLPPHVLVLDVETAGPFLARASAVAAHREALDLHTILLGRSDGIPGRLVAADGSLSLDHPTGTGEPAGMARLSMLGADELADVLSVVRRVTPRPEPGTGPAAAGPPENDHRPPPAQTPERAGERPFDQAVVPASPEGKPPPVRLRVLGLVGLSTAAGPVTEGIRTGSLAITALLAAHPPGLAMADIAATLHPGHDQNAARNLVRTDMSTLRAALRRATGLDTGARFIVYHDRQRRYRLDETLIEVDLWRMLAAIGRANDSDDDTDCLAALREAADRYDGDFAANLEPTWTTAYATTIRRKIAEVWARIAEILEPDQPDDAVAALEKAISFEPVNEDLYQRVMRIHGRRGQLDQVRAAMRRLEARLADLGSAEPSQATKAVAARQLAGGRSSGDQPAASVAAAHPA